MKSAIIMFALKRIFKYLVEHPDVIPGDLDDRFLPLFARIVGAV
ncbi:hypothetical protein ADZZY_10 [Mycobacterium phage Adzzy]|nr:hypothetical protein ADZZY_10 [Mycobacterium phage Adzzy]AGT14259.1 hypothetical protein ADZZY_10 [Mycobacterium phage Adzzy]ATW60138.1 hypothetical protein SEA_PH8S_10 [Mycobacterium phage Ph8s]